MKKRILCFLLVLALLLIPVYADGDGNIDGGGGTGGSGTSHGSWNPGNDGVRVSIVEVSSRSVVATADFTNVGSYLAQFSNSTMHFGKVSKFAYMNGRALTLNGSSYAYYPLAGMPQIIAPNGGNNIAAIKTFFTQAGTVERLATTMGMSYETLISGDYKLLIEPMSYFKYEGDFLAVTATEAALLDMQVSGHLSLWMGTMSHQNLPLGLFLERDDTELGLYAWTGSRSGKQSNYNILYYMGMGLVSFKPKEIIVEIEDDYEFRTDTDVIVAVTISNPGEDITPDDKAYLVLDIGGTIYRKQFVCPGGDKQLVWVKWHTPDEPQVVPIVVTGPGTNKTLYANIVALPEETPPDPTYYDANPAFVYKSIVDYGERTSTEWGEWSAYWVHDPTMHFILGIPIGLCSAGSCDCPKAHGHWEYEFLRYSASLSAEFKLTPDASVPTAYQSRGGWVMPSGYGVNAEVVVSVTASNNTTTYDVTPTQGVVVLFSEFGYETFNRLMTSATDTTGTYRNQKWTLKPNEYSFYNSPLHFTPLWYPDDTPYTVEVVVIDAWTPGGMLYQTMTASIDVSRSILDDWYIRRTK